MTRPAASLRTELVVSGALAAGIGVAGLIASIVAGVDPVRALVVFVVAGLVLGLLQHLVGGRWIRATAASAPPLPAEAATEPSGRTVRRLLITQGLTFLVVIVALFLLRDAFGATFGGVLAGIGAANLVAARWLGEREDEARATVMREAVTSPFAGARRPLYTLPRSDSTLAT